MEFVTLVFAVSKLNHRLVRCSYSLGAYLVLYALLLAPHFDCSIEGASSLRQFFVVPTHKSHVGPRIALREQRGTLEQPLSFAPAEGTSEQNCKGLLPQSLNLALRRCEAVLEACFCH